MTRDQEITFEKKAEKHFKSHKELPPRKNFMCWNRSTNKKAEQNYRDNFDNIFPKNPSVGF